MKGARTAEDVGFEGACAILEGALKGRARREVLDAAFAAGDVDAALTRLRDAMRKHAFKGGGALLTFQAFVRDFDARTRAEGFHVLNSWDHNVHAFTKDNSPVLLLDRFARSRVPSRTDRHPLALLLDHYFFYILALVVMRAWDDGDPNRNLDRVTALVRLLQGPVGSGHQFVANSATLLLMAISHFHPDELAYPRLLERIRTLDLPHQIDFARAEASVLGSHLRWGFPVLYHRDLGRMRADNMGDYPWLLWSLRILLEEFVRLRDSGASEDERQWVLEPLLDALTPDPWAFNGTPPASLEPHAEEHARFLEVLDACRGDLLDELEKLRPTKEAYSPLNYHCNFPHNAIMAKVAIALVDEAAPNLPLDAMFTKRPPDDPEAVSQETLARTLMEYSGARPERLGRRGARLIIYDPSVGLRCFKMVLKTLGTAG